MRPGSAWNSMSGPSAARAGADNDAATNINPMITNRSGFMIT
jgi:hypothetical protein